MQRHPPTPYSIRANGAKATLFRCHVHASEKGGYLSDGLYLPDLPLLIKGDSSSGAENCLAAFAVLIPKNLLIEQKKKFETRTEREKNKSPSVRGLPQSFSRRQMMHSNAIIQE